MKRLIQTIVGVLGLVGCSMTPRPGTALSQIKFAEAPHIVQRGDSYYLRFRIEVAPGSRPLLRAIFTKKTADKAYYYFSVPTSNREFGQLVERPLERDGFTECARRDAVYWLDPDGSENHLTITREEAPAAP